MNNKDKDNFLKMINATFELYQKSYPQIETVRMYFTALEKYSFDDVSKGINLHVIDTDQGQFLPKPADIIRNITGGSETQAEKAWTKVDKSVRTVGPYESLIFDDGIIHRVIQDMGGWIDLCSTSDDEYPFKHNRFITIYRGHVKSGAVDYPRKLIGMSEAENSRKGFEVPKPKLIGNPKLAKLVYQGGNDQSRIGVRTLNELIPHKLLEKDKDKGHSDE